MGTGLKLAGTIDFATVAFVKLRKRHVKQIERIRHASCTFVFVILTPEFAKRIRSHVYVLFSRILFRLRQLAWLSNDYPV